MKLRKKCYHNKRELCCGCPQINRCLKLVINNKQVRKMKLTDEGIKIKHKGDRYYKVIGEV